MGEFGLNMDWLNRSHPYLQEGYGEQDNLRHMDFVLMQFIAIGNELSLKLKPYEDVYEQYCESLNAMIPALTHCQQATQISDEPISMLALFRDALRSALRIAQHCCVSGDGDCIAMPDLIEKVVASSKQLGRETKDYPIEQNLHKFIEEFLPRYLLYDSNLAFEIGEKSALVEPYQLSIKRFKGLDNIAGLSMVFRLPVLAGALRLWTQTWLDQLASHIGDDADDILDDLFEKISGELYVDSAHALLNFEKELPHWALTLLPSDTMPLSGL